MACVLTTSILLPNRGFVAFLSRSAARAAYEKGAPPALRGVLSKTPVFKPPDKTLSASQIDPLKSPRVLGLLRSLRKI